MIFLIQYNRKKGELVDFRSFPETERLAAEDVRLDLELSMIINGLDDEIVLLEAENEYALRQTHSRYFKNLNEIAST